MKTVDILVGVDGADDFLLVDVARQRQLHDKAVDLRIAVELVDLLEQAFLSNVVLEADERAPESACLTGFYLVGYVCFRTSVVTYQNGYKMRRALAGCRHFRNFLGYLLFDFVCCLFTVDDCHTELLF